MMHPCRSVCALVIIFAAAALGCASTATATAASPTKVLETQMALRDLWLGHVLAIRNVAVATMDKNESSRAVAEKTVVRNAKEIAESIQPFYGKAASDGLFKLLAGHWQAMRDYLDATAASDTSQQAAAAQAATANAKDISAFLSGANPNWPKDAVMGLLATHAAQHFQQFHQLKDGEYTQEADTWTGMKQHIYVVADTLTTGLAKQFPDKF